MMSLPIRFSLCRIARAPSRPLARAGVCVVTLTLCAAPAAHADQLLVCGWNSDNATRCGETYITNGSGGLDRPHSLLFHADGSLLVASVGTNSVLRYDSETGAFIETFVTAGDGGLSSPTDITFGPDGDLYVTSFNNGSVMRYDGETGDFIEVFVGPPDNGGITGVEACKFGPDGRFYVLSGGQNRVAVYDPDTGVFIEDFISGGGNGLSDPHNMMFGDDGRLYLSSFGNGRVQRFDAFAGALIDTFISTNLSAPHGMSFGPDGFFHVANFGNNTVTKHDPATGDFLGTVIIGGVAAPIELIFLPEGDAGLADLTDFEVVFGSHIKGGIEQLLNSDDEYLRARSKRGFTAFEPNVADVVIGATTSIESAATFDLTIEARVNNPGGTAKIRFRNWDTNGFDQIATYAAPQVDSTETITSIDATAFVRADDNRIELSSKHVVIAVFSAIGFDSFYDVVQITVK